MEEHLYGEYFQEIYDTLTTANIYIQFLEQLFMTNENCITLMNATTPLFFEYCRIAFVDTLIIKLCWVTDPPGIGEKQNLTIKRLFEHFVTKDAPEYKKLSQKLEDLNSKIKHIRNARNKRYAHLDLKDFRKESNISMEDFTEAFKMLEKIYNGIVKHVPLGIDGVNPETYYSTKVILPFKEDARALLILLKKGLMLEEMIKKLPKEEIEKIFPEIKNDSIRGHVLGYIDQVEETFFQSTAVS